MQNLMILTCETDSVRIDQYLANELSDLSRSYIQKLIGEGHVSINGVVNTSKKILVKADDEIAIEIPDPTLLNIIPENIPLEIV